MGSKSSCILHGYVYSGVMSLILNYLYLFFQYFISDCNEGVAPLKNEQAQHQRQQPTSLLTPSSCGSTVLPPLNQPIFLEAVPFLSSLTIVIIFTWWFFHPSFPSPATFFTRFAFISFVPWISLSSRSSLSISFPLPVHLPLVPVLLPSFLSP